MQCHRRSSISYSAVDSGAIKRYPQWEYLPLLRTGALACCTRIHCSNNNMLHCRRAVRPTTHVNIWTHGTQAISTKNIKALAFAQTMPTTGSGYCLLYIKL